MNAAVSFPAAESGGAVDYDATDNRRGFRRAAWCETSRYSTLCATYFVIHSSIGRTIGLYDSSELSSSCISSSRNPSLYSTFLDTHVFVPRLRFNSS